MSAADRPMQLILPRMAVDLLVEALDAQVSMLSTVAAGSKLEVNAYLLQRSLMFSAVAEAIRQSLVAKTRQA